MAYKKTVAGDNNQANETASHNRLIINTGAGFTVFAVYAVILVTAVIVFLAIAFGEVLKWGVALTVGALVITGWLWLILFLKRSASHTSTMIDIHKYKRDQAWLESRVAVREALYALYLDENDNLQFRDTKQITENRHYPAQIEAPRERVDDKTIIELFDKGLSGRSIEKALDKEVPFRHIAKVLSAYRPEWNKKGKIVEGTFEDVEDEPYA